jgi:hypothetical protein
VPVAVGTAVACAMTSLKSLIVPSVGNAAHRLVPRPFVI